MANPPRASLVMPFERSFSRKLQICAARHKLDQAREGYWKRFLSTVSSPKRSVPMKGGARRTMIEMKIVCTDEPKKYSGSKVEKELQITRKSVLSSFHFMPFDPYAKVISLGGGLTKFPQQIDQPTFVILGNGITGSDVFDR